MRYSCFYSFPFTKVELYLQTLPGKYDNFKTDKQLTSNS